MLSLVLKKTHQKLMKLQKFLLWTDLLKIFIQKSDGKS